MVICLERSADLHMAQLIPLPLTVSCFSKIQIGFTFLVPAHLGSPGQCAVKCGCVYVLNGCVCLLYVGYLKEEGCQLSYRTFLKETKHLNEYRTMLEAGHEYPTSVCGKNLTAMINEYGRWKLNGN